MLDVKKETHHASAGFETGEQDFVERNCNQSGKCSAHRVQMEHRDTKQGQAE